MGSQLFTQLGKLERELVKVTKRCAVIDRLEAKLVTLRARAAPAVAKREGLAQAILHIRQAIEITGATATVGDKRKTNPRAKSQKNLEQLARMRAKRFGRPEAATAATGKEAEPLAQSPADPALSGAIENGHGELELVFSDEGLRNAAVAALKGRGFTRPQGNGRPAEKQYKTSQIGSSTFMVSWLEPEP